MKYIWSLFLFPLLIILALSFLVGIVVFVIDVFRWSKRPEKFEDISKIIGKDNKNEIKEVKSNINDDIF